MVVINISHVQLLYIVVVINLAIMNYVATVCICWWLIAIFSIVVTLVNINFLLAMQFNCRLGQLFCGYGPYSPLFSWLVHDITSSMENAL